MGGRVDAGGTGHVGVAPGALISRLTVGVHLGRLGLRFLAADHARALLRSAGPAGDQGICNAGH